LPGAIRGKWKLPTYLLEQNLKARVKIYISVKGELLKTELIESSGNSEFDSRALNAVRESAPFAAPPEPVGIRLTRYGVILGFPL
jgi:TonB family protein